VIKGARSNCRGTYIHSDLDGPRQAELDVAILRNKLTSNPDWTKRASALANANLKLFPRFSAGQVTTALKDAPVVMVTGPRQCGKTALVREFSDTHRYVSWTTIRSWSPPAATRGGSCVE
jgi:polynucleotide 5'-kinase involved in rRNA processing